MNPPDYNSPTALKACLAERGMAMHKHFGQNFLINERARLRIADALEAEGEVWEVGPGLGAMSGLLMQRAQRLTAFEIDAGFVNALHDFFPDEIASGKLRLVEGDVLRTWKRELAESGTPRRLFGNLPYTIAAVFIAATIEEGVRFERCIFTVQKEVALRMTAPCASQDYSSFSVLCQWAYEIKPLLDLGGGSFWPRPRVDSRSVVLTPRSDFPRCADAAFFIRMQRALFASRRKTVRNNLSAFLADEGAAAAALDRAGIPPSVRAETLSVDELLRLSDCCLR